MVMRDLEAQQMADRAALIRTALERAGWRLRTAAYLLGVSRSWLQRQLRDRYPGLDAERREKGPVWGKAARDGRPGCGGRRTVDPSCMPTEVDES